MERQIDRELVFVISRKSGRTLHIEIDRDKIGEKIIDTERQRRDRQVERDGETDSQRTSFCDKQEICENIRYRD